MSWFRARFHVILQPKVPDDFKSVATNYATFEGKLTHFTTLGYKGFKTLTSEINLKELIPLLNIVHKNSFRSGPISFEKRLPERGGA